MVENDFETVTCPPKLVDRALALVLGSLPRVQQLDIAAATLPTHLGGLFVAQQGEDLLGACWAHPQPGNTAIFWPPQLLSGEDENVTSTLVEAVTGWLDERGIALAQAMFSDRDVSVAKMLERYQFVFLSELTYLYCDPNADIEYQPVVGRLSYETYDPTQRDRLIELIKATYVDSLDCALLDGQREMDDVIDGYAATGVWDPRLWFFVRRRGEDVGVLLHSTYPDIAHREVTYLGVIPEVRGQRIGLAIVRHSQQLAREAGMNGLILAVDASNEPAMQMYVDAGFQQSDRRAVFVRLHQRGRTSAQKTSAA